MEKQKLHKMGTDNGGGGLVEKRIMTKEGSKEGRKKA